MARLRTVQDVISKLPRTDYTEIPAPKYSYNPSTDETRPKLCLAVESMRNHMSDEGWQIMDGFFPRYRLAGHNLDIPTTHVPNILTTYNPSVVILQDKREWDVTPGNFRDPNARFFGVHALLERPDIFKLTILKDSHQAPEYHRESAEEIGCHAWIIYYHPKIVKHLAPYLREQHLIRTYHSIDLEVAPPLTTRRKDLAILSGAVSRVYPLRRRLFNDPMLKLTDRVYHPGYHRAGTDTPGFLNKISGYKVLIATTSIYGYALRKIVEGVACGCRVITDLPTDDVMPEIDDNLIRIPTNISGGDLTEIIRKACTDWDEDRQVDYAKKARRFYEYRNQCDTIADRIEELRRDYR